MLQTTSLSVDSTVRRRVLNELNKEPTVVRAADANRPLSGFRCQIDHQQRLDSSFERRNDLNSVSNATLKTCEKHFPSEFRTRIESPAAVQRNTPASDAENVPPVNDADVKQQPRHSTVEKECQTTKSSVRQWKTKKEQIRRVKLSLCVLGWILCCPCWTIGFSLRDRSPYHHSPSSPPYRRRDNRCPQQPSSDTTSPSSLPCQTLYHADSVGSLADPCWPFDEILS